MATTICFARAILEARVHGDYERTPFFKEPIAKPRVIGRAERETARQSRARWLCAAIDLSRSRSRRGRAQLERIACPQLRWHECCLQLMMYHRPSLCAYRRSNF
jgi:hypothetical protein